MSKKYKIAIFFSICLMFNKVQASTIVSGINNFPSSYQGYLEKLSQKHPNWKFEALYTGLDWNYVIDEENIFGRNLVPINYSDSWKNKTEGQYNVEVDEGWVDSSTEAVEYCMDPRNFLNEVRIFQFEDLSYDENTNDLSGIEKILYGTEFYQKQVSYLDSSGNTITMSEKYSDLILKAGKISKVNSYHLASRIKQEVGPFLSHSSISGNVEGFEGLYNFYNIGATSSVEPLGAIKNGLQYAKDGKKAKEETKIKYLIPWNTKEKAITGGAIFIGSSYINVGQNTIYLQKFDVEGDSLFWHQYMTNVLAPYNESKSIYNGYNKAGILDNNLSFIIPVFDNMPEYPTDSPSINLDDFLNDNKKVYCNATNVNIRTGPSTSYEIITTVTKYDKMTRLKKGTSGWDKVILENGIIGYIYQTYVTEVAENYEIDFGDLQVEDFEISGIYKNTVLEIKQKIKTDLEIQIVNSQNKVLKGTELVGTGSKILVKENEKILEEYKIILYGDVNGDGKINSIDLLKIQRHILEIENLDEIYLKAANVRKTEKEPSSVDLLLIQRHILGLQEIVQ